MSKRKKAKTKYPVVEVKPPKDLMAERLRALFEESKAQLDYTESVTSFDPMINIVENKNGETVLLYEIYMYPDDEDEQPIEDAQKIKKDNSPPISVEDKPKESETIPVMPVTDKPEKPETIQPTHSESIQEKKPEPAQQIPKEDKGKHNKGRRRNDTSCALLKAFFDVNCERGVTRKEVCDFLNVATYKEAKKIIEEFGLESYASIILDLRSASQPNGKPVIPQLKTSENEVEAPKKEEPKVQQAPKVEKKVITENPSPQKNADTNTGEQPSQTAKPEILMDVIFGKHIKKTYLLDPALLTKMTTDEFTNMLNKLCSYNIIPVFLLFKSTLEFLDSVKNEIDLAKKLLKFFALDQDESYHKLVDGTSPSADGLVSYCVKNNVSLISGNVKYILDAKLNGVNVFIPTTILDKFPNPLKGTGKVGFDTSSIIQEDNVSTELLKDILAYYGELILPDMVIKECRNNLSYLVVIAALYGTIIVTGQSVINDSRIVDFYKKNPVKCVYTSDFGFSLFARFAKVECKLLFTNEPHSNLLEVLRNNDTMRFCVNKEVLLSSEIFSVGTENQIFVKTDNKKFIISVFTRDGVPRKQKGNHGSQQVTAYPTEIVVIRRESSIMILKLLTKNKGLILYWGETSKVPNNLKKWL